MKKVWLKAGLSYVARGISCVKGKIVDVEDDVAARLMKTGRFEIADVEPAASEFAESALAPEFTAPTSDPPVPEFTTPAPDTPVPGVAELVSDPLAVAAKYDRITSMRKDELIAFAEAQDINIEDCKNNEERIQRIQSEMDRKVFVRLASEE